MIAAPLAEGAKTPTTVRRIGNLLPGAPPTPAELQEEYAQYAPLRALGWVEGRNLLVERRYAERDDLFRPLAEELVRLKVEIIVTDGTTAALAAKNATTTVPIVMYTSGDPVATGLVASLARPGGNITGFSLAGPEINAKKLALLRELLPGLQRVGVLETNNPYYRAVRKGFEQTCRSVGIQPVFVEVAAAGEMESAIAEMARRGAQAVFVNRDSLFYENRVLLMSAAVKHALPTIAAFKDMLEGGALLSYSNTIAEQNQRHAAFIDRILRGAKPADLPIEQPTKFELGINLRTAKALGIKIPSSLLLQANEVIQ